MFINEAYVVALSLDEATKFASEYDSHIDIEDAIAELVKLRQPKGKVSPYKIFKVRECFEAVCEVSIEAREIVGGGK